jgi:cation transport regulator ChaB
MSDKSGLDRIPVQVTITLTSGEKLRGAIGVTRGRKLGDLLNSGAPFILLESDDGRPVYLSLASVQQITSNQMPQADQLEESRRSLEASSLYQILNVEETCDLATLQHKHRELAKLYHPDQYTNVRLPEEVTKYINDMARRINMAFSQLSAEIKRRDAMMAERTAREAAMGQSRRFGEGGRS